MKLHLPLNKKHSSFKYERNSYEVNEEFKSITVNTNTAKVGFVTTDKDIAVVVCYEPKKSKHTVMVKDDTLMIELSDTKKWYEHIGVTVEPPEITVYIPQKQYGDICVKASTGSISIGNMNANSLDLAVTTGRIELSAVNCTSKIKVDLSTGSANICKVECGSFLSYASTGGITLKNVVASESMNIECSTGNIKLEESNAPELYIKTTTGKVEVIPNRSENSH